MRTQEEINRQIEGLKNQKEALPEYSQLGTPNWAMADAQIDILKGGDIADYELEEWDDQEGDEGEIYRAAEEAVDWLDEANDGDLFDKEYEPKVSNNTKIMNISIIATNDNVTIIRAGETLVVNKQKNRDVFDNLIEKVKNNEVKWITDHFEKIRSDIEMKSNTNFVIERGKVVLKGTKIPIPEAILKKLMELEKESEPILPLLKFWRKLSENPSEESRQDLYGFMVANNIPITEEGDIVTEKGVVQKSGGFLGDLVDKHSRSVNNSIGVIVSMPREKVNPNRNQTCSTGLHAGAPDYVRDWYKDDIIIECIVNPRDVVSVPVDYKNTKMRVCQYYVAGYSRKSTRPADKVVKLSDFFTTPLPEQKEVMEKQSIAEQSAPSPKPEDEVVVTKAVVTEAVTQDAVDFDSMSAKAIVHYIKDKTGEEITFSLKSKKSIIKKAEELLQIHQIKQNS